MNDSALPRGYFAIGSLRGAPVRVHWSTPIGAFVLCGGAFVPVAWLAFFALVLFHELGHASLVRRAGFRVVTIDIHALGGVCRWAGRPSDLARAQIAWGGVLAQALLLIAMSLATPIFRSFHHPWLTQIVETWTGANFAMIVLNLIPVRPFDGAEAWKLVPYLFKSARFKSPLVKSEGGSKKRSRADDRRLAEIREIERKLQALRAEGDDGENDTRLH